MKTPTLMRSVIALLLGLALGAAHAQYPSKPLRLLVPFPPGGAADATARALSIGLGAEFGQQIVIENKGGAGGIIATEQAARSAPDGYTLLLAAVGPFVVSPAMGQKLPYDPVRDFVPIGLTATFANALVLHPSVQANSVAEFIALARRQPGKLSYGHPGIGSSGHLAGELFKSMTGTDILSVAYKGGGPLMTDLLGGQINLSFATTPSAMPHIKAGKVKVLGVTSTGRDPALPQAPTIAEAGVAGYEASFWYGLVLPAGAPADLARRISQAQMNALAKPEIVAILAPQGLIAAPSSPEAFVDLMRRDLEKWTRVAKEAGIKVE